MEVFTLIFASNVCKYCTHDLNKLYIYEKCSYSHMRCTSFYENWLDITWETSISLPSIEHWKKWAPFKKKKKKEKKKRKKQQQKQKQQKTKTTTKKQNKTKKKKKQKKTRDIVTLSRQANNQRKAKQSVPSSQTRRSQY